jgi:hypothetical protein
MCSDGWREGNKEEIEHGSCEFEYPILNCCYFFDRRFRCKLIHLFSRQMKSLTQQFIIVSNQSSDEIRRQSEKLQIKHYLSLLCPGVGGLVRRNCNFFHESEAKVKKFGFFIWQFYWALSGIVL